MVVQPTMVVKVPPVAGQTNRGHRRSQSLTAGKTWSPGVRDRERERERKLSGLKPIVGEMGEKVPEKEKESASTRDKSKEALPMSPSPSISISASQSHSNSPQSPTLMRRFGSLFVGESSGSTYQPKRRLSLFGGGHAPGHGHGRESTAGGGEGGEVGDIHHRDYAETDTESARAKRDRKIQIVESEKPSSTNQGGMLSHSASQPLSSSHRRAATIIDTATRRSGGTHGHGHERRASAIVQGFGLGRSSTVKRPSTATDSSFPVGRFKAVNSDEEGGEQGDDEQRLTDKEDESFKPVYMKGLFRYVFSPSRFCRVCIYRVMQCGDNHF